MQIAIGDNALHIATCECFPTIEGLELNVTAGVAPGGSEHRVHLVFSHDEAIEIMKTVARIILELNARTEEEPIGPMDVLGHVVAQAKEGGE